MVGDHQRLAETADRRTEEPRLGLAEGTHGVMQGDVFKAVSKCQCWAIPHSQMVKGKSTVVGQVWAGVELYKDAGFHWSSFLFNRPGFSLRSLPLKATATWCINYGWGVTDVTPQPSKR